MKREVKSSKSIYIFILNILAILGVITLHHNGIAHIYSTERHWATALFFEVIFYWAVPIFLMNTGATLIGYRKRYDTKTFFKKRLKKIVIPLVFWSIVVYFWKTSVGTLKPADSIFDFAKLFFSDGIEYIYYFMFTILGIYITIPIFSFIAEKDKSDKTLKYIVCALFVTQSTIPLLFRLFGIALHPGLAINITGQMIFPILGYLLSKNQISKKWRIIAYLLGIASCVFRYLFTYIASSNKGSIDKMLFDYSQFHSVLLAISVFIFIKQIKWEKIFKNERSVKVLASVSSCSFGIYLSHLIVMYYEKNDSRYLFPFYHL